jgi:hypothetical protein
MYSKQNNSVGNMDLKNESFQTNRSGAGDLCRKYPCKNLTLTNSCVIISETKLMDGWRISSLNFVHL